MGWYINIMKGKMSLSTLFLIDGTTIGLKGLPCVFTDIPANETGQLFTVLEVRLVQELPHEGDGG